VRKLIFKLNLIGIEYLFYHDFSFELSLYYSLFFENKLCVLIFQVLQIREVKHVC